MHSQLLDARMRPHEVSGILAAVLAASSRPLTRILEDLGDTKLSIRVLADGERPLREPERFRLSAAGIARCRWRAGLLVADGGVVAASTVLVWLPARIPFDACEELNAAAEPAGVILGRLGMRRVDRRAMATTGMEDVTGQGAAVRSTAVLEVGGQAVGYADECVTKAFAERLASC